jgi:hypothetical protein
LAKEDLAPADAAAFLRILEARKAGRVDLVTSEVTNVEIGRIPEAHRVRHKMIYNLLTDVPAARTHSFRGVLAVAGGVHGHIPDPLFIALGKLLPDAEDIEHVFQTAKNNVAFLITVDNRTMLRHSSVVAQLCGVRLMTPVGFEHAVLAGK